MWKFLALALIAVAAAYEVEEDVIVGTDANLDEIIKANQYVLVEFYAPWCGHCKHLAPEYAKAAGTLAKNGSPVKLVKVDATIHSATAEKYEVQGYPTVKWIKGGSASEYSGGRTADDIVNWINKKSGPPAAKLATAEAAKALTDGNEVVVLGFFADETSAEAKAFIEAADKSELTYGIATDAAVAAAYNVAAPKILVVKKFDEGQVEYTGDYTSEAIGQFATANSLPILVEFSDATAQKIFGGEIKSHNILFLKKTSPNANELLEVMREAGKDFRGKVLFIYINADVDDNQRILEFFGIKDADLPTVRLINLAADMAKYKPQSTDLTAASVKQFVTDFQDGKLKQFLQSETTPADWNAKPVKVLTGENFAQVALDTKSNAFVEFYAPWCGHCKQLVPIWDKLAEKYVGNDKIVIAKIDSTANELENIKVQSFPTIKFFPAGENAQPIDYEGARTVAGFADFIEKQTGVSVTLTEEEKSEAQGAEEEEPYEAYDDSAAAGGESVEHTDL